MALSRTVAASLGGLLALSLFAVWWLGEGPDATSVTVGEPSPLAPRDASSSSREVGFEQFPPVERERRSSPATDDAVSLSAAPSVESPSPFGRGWRLRGRLLGLDAKIPWSAPLIVSVSDAEEWERSRSTVRVSVAEDGSFDGSLDALASRLEMATSLRVTFDDPRYVPDETLIPLPGAPWTRAGRIGNSRDRAVFGDDPPKRAGRFRMKDPVRQAWLQSPRALDLEHTVRLASGITGRVVGPDARALVAHVALFDAKEGTWNPSPIAQTLCSDDGTYVLRTGAVGRFLVVAFARSVEERAPVDGGSIVPVHALRPASDLCIGVKGGSTQAPTLTMSQGARISGSLRQAGGVGERGPIDGASVIAVRQVEGGTMLEPDGPRLWVDASRRVEYATKVAPTDQHGAYQLEGLEHGGHYSVGVHSVEGLIVGRSLKEKTRNVIAPGEGQHLLLNVAKLRVRVDTSGESDNGPVEVRLSRRERMTSATLSEGLWSTFLVDPGHTYELEARREFYEDTSEFVEVKTSRSLVLALPRTREAATLLLKVNAGAAPFETMFDIDPLSPPIGLDRIASVRIGKDGLVVDHVPLGRYRVHLARTKALWGEDGVPNEPSGWHAPWSGDVTVGPRGATLDAKLTFLGAVRVLGERAAHTVSDALGRVRVIIEVSPAQMNDLVPESERERARAKEELTFRVVLGTATLLPVALPVGTYRISMPRVSPRAEHVRVRRGEVTEVTFSGESP